MSPNPPNGIITQYHIQYRKISSSYYYSVYHRSSALSHTVTGLTPNTKYNFRIRALTKVGAGSFKYIECHTGKIS